MNGRYEYQVISERDSKLWGDFDMDALQTKLNEQAAAGWRLAEGLAVSSVWKSGKTQIVLILERAVVAEPR